MGRIGIISDIHSNLHALRAALDRLGELDVRTIVCLGDIVGYGPHPVDCLNLVKRCASVIIAGNHDLGVIDPDIARGFNGAARDALDWTRRTLTPLHMDALTRLPLRATVDPHLTLVHDCPVPAPTDYVHNISIAALAFRGFETTACLLGHTHVPIVFEAPGDVAPEAIVADDVTAHAPGDGQPLRLQIGRRYICNPGSVGQPRDADPRASFAVFDDEALTFTVHRQEYDIDAVQEATYRAGLPFVLAERLSIGA